MIGDVYITLERNESDYINYNEIAGLLKYSEGENNVKKQLKLLCLIFVKRNEE